MGAQFDVAKVCDKDRDGGPLQSLPQFMLGVGGCSMIPGLEGRLKREVDARAGQPRDIYITCMPEPERYHAAFVGGSILAGLPQFVEHNFVHKV